MPRSTGAQAADRARFPVHSVGVSSPLGGDPAYSATLIRWAMTNVVLRRLTRRGSTLAPVHPPPCPRNRSQTCSETAGTAPMQTNWTDSRAVFDAMLLQGPVDVPSQTASGICALLRHLPGRSARELLTRYGMWPLAQPRTGSADGSYAGDATSWSTWGKRARRRDRPAVRKACTEYRQGDSRPPGYTGFSHAFRA